MKSTTRFILWFIVVVLILGAAALLPFPTLSPNAKLEVEAKPPLLLIEQVGMTNYYGIYVLTDTKTRHRFLFADGGHNGCSFILIPEDGMGD